VVWIERRGRWCGMAGFQAASTRGKMGPGKVRGGRVARLDSKPGAGETDGGQTAARRRCPCFGRPRKKKGIQWVDPDAKRKEVRGFSVNIKFSAVLGLK